MSTLFPGLQDNDQVYFILVTGATGKQGGAQANQTFTTLAFTHDQTYPSAQALRQKSSNIKIVQGLFTRKCFFSKEEVVFCLLLAARVA